MKKKELVYRELLVAEGKKTTQLRLAKVLGVSLSTVNNALKPLVKMGAVRVSPRGLRIVDYEKVLIHWANVRDLDKEVVYATRSESSAREIESMMPQGAVFTAYSGYKLKYGDAPADYSEVYVYAGGKTLEEIKKRFPESGKTPNIFVLKPDSRLAGLSGESAAPAPQLFVDLWNLKSWYAKDFVNTLRERLL